METSSLDRLHAGVRQSVWLRRFTVLTRVLLALGFLPSGITKLLGNRFTILGIDNPVGFFFEAFYRSGFYWNFIGASQLAAAALLVLPRTATLGALVYFPIILNTRHHPPGAPRNPHHGSCARKLYSLCDYAASMLCRRPTHPTRNARAVAISCSLLA